MKSAFEILNTERMRRERQEAFTREFLSVVPRLALFVLFAAAASFWVGPKAVGQFQYDMEASE